MSIIEDELRRVLDAHSGDAPPAADRSARLGRRIARHQRVRVVATAAVAAVLLMTASVGVAVTLAGRRNPGPAGPGPMPRYAAGGRLVASTTVRTARSHALTLVYTPRDWSFAIGVSCADTPEAMVVVSVNGHYLTTLRCAEGGPTDVLRPRFDQPADRFWSTGYDVAPGRPMTVSAQVTAYVGGHFGRTTPAAAPHGVASIGVYRDVPWSAYPLPARPAGPAPGFMLGTSMAYAEMIADLRADDTDPNAIRTVPVVLRTDLSIDVGTASPGAVAVFVDGTQVEGCVVYVWYSGCRDGGNVLTTGVGTLVAFHVGQRVTVRVVPMHFTGPAAWAVRVFGR